MIVIRVVIVDDHAMVRVGLAALINDQPDMEVVAQGASAAEGVQLAEQHHPDVLLTDLRMPDLDGQDLIRIVLARLPKMKIVILSSYSTPEDVRQAFDAGARGYLPKTLDSNALVDALRRVHRGERVPVGESSLGNLPRLSFREREVLKGIAVGETNVELAARLGVTAGTVKSYVTRILQKLGAELPVVCRDQHGGR